MEDDERAVWSLGLRVPGLDEGTFAVSDDSSSLS